MNNRVVIFIDGSNLYHSLVEECDKQNLNFGKFVKALSRRISNRLLRAYYYNVIRKDQSDPMYKGEVGFLNAIREMPFIDLRLPAERAMFQQDTAIDVMIAVDMVSMAYRDVYDHAILVSGDGDFVHAVREVKWVGKQVYVAAFRNNLSIALKREVDEYIELDNEFFNDLWNKEQ